MKETLNDQKFSKIERSNNFQFQDRKNDSLPYNIINVSWRCAQVLARILRTDKNVNHEIISLSNLGRYGQEIANEGYNILSLDMKKYRLNLKKLIELYKILKNRNHNVIQTWMYHADLIGGILGYALNKKVYWNTNSDLNTKWASYITILVQRICSLYQKKYLTKYYLVQIEHHKFIWTLVMIALNF